MNEFYQLTLSANADFQLLVSSQLARLEMIPDVRSSKRRLVHAGVLSLRSSTKAELEDLAKDLIISKAERGKKPKHQVIQVDRVFSDLARLISATAAVDLGYRGHTRHFMHLGLVSMSTCDDEDFQTLIYASEEYETAQNEDNTS